MTGLPLLDVDNLCVSARLADGRVVPILRDISFRIARGATLGIVGESGSGKTVLALAVMGLLAGNAAVTGRIALGGMPLLDLDDDAMGAVRGRRIGMIFQEPMTALNPAMTIGDQIAEGIVWHRGISWRDARVTAVNLLDRVRIADAGRRAGHYPHELSGGQRQRVGIAIALALDPELMIADEPTTALDATVQAEILDILGELVRDEGMALLLVSHDLGVVARATERMLVLYAGTRMEEGPTAEVLVDPRNPYTRGLLAAISVRHAGRQRLQPIPGTIPDIADLPPGCRFSGRCPHEIAACRAGEPPWRQVSPDRGLRCIRADPDGRPMP